MAATGGVVSSAKVAVAVVAADIVIVHVPVPPQPPPLQPVKADEQFVPQVIPAGTLVTVPEPVPARTTASETPEVIVKVGAFEVPPPGAGVTTVTCAVPTVATSVARIVARSCVLLANVVARLVPFHRTPELATKLLPFTVNVRPATPARTLVGAS